MKHHRSQPEDDLSSCRLLLSRQTVSCRDKRGKFSSWAIFNFALKLMTTHILKPEVKTSRAQINRIIISVETEIQILIEPMCLIHSVSRGIIRGKLMSLRKTFKILYQKLRTTVGNTRRARFEESHLIHSKKKKINK